MSRHSSFHEYLQTHAVKSSDQLVEDIDHLTKYIWTSLEDPDTLSEILLQLSVKNVGLGNYLIDAMDELRVADTTYKYKLESQIMELIEDGMAVNKAEVKSKLTLHEDIKKLNRLQRNVDILKIKRTDTEKVIDAARSRLSLIKQDIQK